MCLIESSKEIWRIVSYFGGAADGVLIQLWQLELHVLEMLKLASENAENKAQEVIVMSKSEKASIMVLAFWRMTDGGFNKGSVLRRNSLRVNRNLKLHLLKYLLGLRHRWHWKMTERRRKAQEGRRNGKEKQSKVVCERDIA